jgi:hypothetical protein
LQWVALFFAGTAKENATEGLAWVSDELERMDRTEEDVMIEGGALFLFLAVASVALFSFLAVSVWSRRKEKRERSVLPRRNGEENRGKPGCECNFRTGTAP